MSLAGCDRVPLCKGDCILSQLINLDLSVSPSSVERVHAMWRGFGFIPLSPGSCLFARGTLERRKEEKGKYSTLALG